ncbi:hypothetical protein B0H14DRAFT_3663483 [Mycena olivaceomarginata]|nr:hypothetical protein B0H14DRAFT_3663483 [Mycena olivaceomarginata]
MNQTSIWPRISGGLKSRRGPQSEFGFSPTHHIAPPQGNATVPRPNETTFSVVDERYRRGWKGVAEVIFEAESVLHPDFATKAGQCGDIDVLGLEVCIQDLEVAERRDDERPRELEHNIAVKRLSSERGQLRPGQCYVFNSSTPENDCAQQRHLQKRDFDVAVQLQGSEERHWAIHCELGVRKGRSFQGYVSPLATNLGQKSRRARTCQRWPTGVVWEEVDEYLSGDFVRKRQDGVFSRKGALKIQDLRVEIRETSTIRCNEHEHTKSFCRVVFKLRVGCVERREEYRWSGHWYGLEIESADNFPERYQTIGRGPQLYSSPVFETTLVQFDISVDIFLPRERATGTEGLAEWWPSLRIDLQHRTKQGKEITSIRPPGVKLRKGKGTRLEHVLLTEALLRISNLELNA